MSEVEFSEEESFRTMRPVGFKTKRGGMSEFIIKTGLAKNTKGAVIVLLVVAAVVAAVTAVIFFFAL